MKALKVAIVMILVLNAGVSLFNWFFEEEPALTDYRSQSHMQAPAAHGLDLSALTTLVKEVRSGQELERKLNVAGSINNLDLDGDTKADYIKVTEFGDLKNNIGYSLTTEPIRNEEQEVAVVTIEKNSENAEIQVVGNTQIYGEDAVFNDWTPIKRQQSESEIKGSNGTPYYHSYFYPRPLWLSPWYFGFYPPFFSPFSIIGHTTYVSRMGNYRANTVQTGQNRFQKRNSSNLVNPNRGKTANKGIRRSLKRPTRTQKKFQVNQASKVRSGGFGQKRSSSSRFNQNSGKTQRSSFSNRKSSFGRSSSFQRKSSFFSSSSLRSERSRSRSFSFGGK